MSDFKSLFTASNKTFSIQPSTTGTGIDLSSLGYNNTLDSDVTGSDYTTFNTTTNDLYTTNGTDILFASDCTAAYEIFTSTSNSNATSYTYTPPSNHPYQWFHIVAIGGGGGGGGGGSSYDNTVSGTNAKKGGGGGGGGGAGVVITQSYELQKDSNGNYESFTISIGNRGNGGNGGAASLNDGNNGKDGGDTTVSYSNGLISITSYGGTKGLKGTHGSANNTGAGGSGGSSGSTSLTSTSTLSSDNHKWDGLSGHSGAVNAGGTGGSISSAAKSYLIASTLSEYGYGGDGGQGANSGIGGVGTNGTHGTGGVVYIIWKTAYDTIELRDPPPGGDKIHYTTTWTGLYDGTATSSSGSYIIDNSAIIRESAENYFSESSYTYHGWGSYSSGPKITLTAKNNSNNTVNGYLFNNSGAVCFIEENTNTISWYASNLEVYITINGSTETYTYKMMSKFNVTASDPTYEIAFPY